MIWSSNSTDSGCMAVVGLGSGLRFRGVLFGVGVLR